MKIKALTPWFGGKRSLAPEIVAELGSHTQYFEPFCGSMAVLLAKEPSQKETVNDLHGDLVNLARVIADADVAPQLYSKLSSTPFSEDLLDEARWRLDERVAVVDGKPSDSQVDRAYWYFLASWMGRNGTAGTERVDYQIAVRWTAGGGSPTVRWRNAVESLPAWHRRLLNVVILCRDSMKILDRFEDTPKTAIYADPPYMHRTRSTQSTKSGGGGRYLHDFEDVPVNGLLNDPGPHEEVARILRSYERARVVVSYYDCDRVRELYDGWTFVDKTRHKHLHAQAGRGARPKKAPELLIINGPSITAAT